MHCEGKNEGQLCRFLRRNFRELKNLSSPLRWSTGLIGLERGLWRSVDLAARPVCEFCAVASFWIVEALSVGCSWPDYKMLWSKKLVRKQKSQIELGGHVDPRAKIAFQPDQTSALPEG